MPERLLLSTAFNKCKRHKKERYFYYYYFVAGCFFVCRRIEMGECEKTFGRFWMIQAVFVEPQQGQKIEHALNLLAVGEIWRGQQ